MQEFWVKFMEQYPAKLASAKAEVGSPDGIWAAALEKTGQQRNNGGGSNGGSGGRTARRITTSSSVSSPSSSSSVGMGSWAALGVEGMSEQQLLADR